MAAVTAIPIDNDNNADNIVVTTNICYVAAFAFGKCIAHIFEYIAYRLPIPMMENNDNTDNNDNEEEVEEMEKEL